MTVTVRQKAYVPAERGRWPKHVRRGGRPHSVAHNVTLALTFAFIISAFVESFLTSEQFGTVSRAMGGLLILSSFTTALASNSLRLHRFHFALVAFVLWVGVGTAWSPDAATGSRFFMDYLQAPIICVIIYNACSEVSDVIWLMRAYVIGTTVLAINILFNYYSGAFVFGFRVTASIFDPNDISMLLCSAIPITVYMIIKSESRWISCLSFLYVFVAIPSVLLTASRAGIIALIVACVCSLFMFRVSIKSIIIYTIPMMIASLFAVKFLPDATLSRFGTIWYEIRYGTLNERTDIWTAAAATIEDTAFLGHGTSSFAASIGHAPHNAFLGALFDNGFVGLVLFLTVWVAVILAVLPMQPRERWLWMVVGIIILGMLLTLNLERRRQFWILISLAVTHGACQRRQGLIAPTPVMAQKKDFLDVPNVDELASFREDSSQLQ